MQLVKRTSCQTAVQKPLLQEKVQRKLGLNHIILSWQKYLEDKPLKMLTVQTIQIVLVSVVVAAAVAVLVKAAAAVIVNKLIIHLLCEHHLFCEQKLVIFAGRPQPWLLVHDVVAFIKTMWSQKVKWVKIM